MSSSTGTKKDTFANYGAGSAANKQLGANAENLYGTLAPTLTAQAVHPQGYTPQEKSAIKTAGEQSAGGSMAGATGQGALLAARTRNAGAGANAIQQSGRNASDELSKVATGTEVGSADLANQKQQNAEKGLGDLNKTELGGSLEALGLSNKALGVANEAQPSFWSRMAGIAGAPIAKGLGDRISGNLFG